MHDAFLEAPLSVTRIGNLEKKYGITLDAQFVQILNALREWRRFNNPPPIITCACGCGGCIEGRDDYGKRRRFIRGHGSNFGHGSWRRRGPDRRPRERHEQITPEARAERARKASAAARAKYVPATHCRRGHEWTRGNTYWSTSRDGSKSRSCRTCALERYAMRGTHSIDGAELTNGEF
jgi:hypothetical protein